MIKKEGKHLANARVDVDYSGKKPKIKFDYPGKNPKKDSLKQGGLGILLVLTWFIIGGIPLMILGIDYNRPEATSFPEECGNISFDNFGYHYESSLSGDLNYSTNYSYKAVHGFNITCDNETKEFEYGFEYAKFKEKSEKGPDWLYIIMISWAYISIFPAWFINRHFFTKWLVKKEWYQKWLPKANAEGIIIKKIYRKYKKFHSKDLIENIALIPHFSNVVLEYKTEGDFSEYLEKIKIREYRTREINTKTKKIGKEKYNNFKWYAVFIFKQKPIKGHLEVIYR